VLSAAVVCVVGNEDESEKEDDDDDETGDTDGTAVVASLSSFSAIRLHNLPAVEPTRKIHVRGFFDPMTLLYEVIGELLEEDISLSISPEKLTKGV